MRLWTYYGAPRINAKRRIRCLMGQVAALELTNHVAWIAADIVLDIVDNLIS